MKGFSIGATEVLRIATPFVNDAFSLAEGLAYMIVISISYGSCIFMYANPSAKEKASLTKGVAILNTSVAPMLNPFIYTLRNQQVKQAFKDMVYKAVFSANK